MNDLLYLRQLLPIERNAHSATRRKLEKADHDRQRYAKRITFLQGRHEILAREYRALKIECNILRAALDSCERRLLDAKKKTDTP